MMKLIGKLLGGVATAAALAALIPYTSDYDAETDTQKTHALLWTLTSKPNLEGKRSYHFAFGKEDDPVIEFRAGESEAEAAAREARLRYDLTAKEAGDAPLSPEDLALPAPEHTEDELRAARDTARLRAAEVRARADRLRGAMAAGGSEDALSAREAELTAEITRLQGEYDALTLAMDALAEANTDLQNRFSPALGRRAAEIFAQLTDGRYDAVALDRSFRLAAEPQGSYTPRDAQYLSAGALDQLYLSVRLAICELALPQGDPIPLILDDALTNFDDSRCAAALRFLRQEAESRQVLLFTCHSREAEFFRDDPAVRIQQLG